MNNKVTDNEVIPEEEGPKADETLLTFQQKLKEVKKMIEVIQELYTSGLENSEMRGLHNRTL